MHLCPLFRHAQQILLWAECRLLYMNLHYRVKKYGMRHSVKLGAEAWGIATPPSSGGVHIAEVGRAEVDLFASGETTHCPLWFTLTLPSPLGLDAIVQTWTRLCLHAFPPIALLPAVLARVHQGQFHLLLVAPL